MNDGSELKSLLSKNYHWIEHTAELMFPKFKLKIKNIFEPYRVYLNETNAILSLSLQKEDPLTLERKSYSCYEIKLSSPFEMDSLRLYDGTRNIVASENSKEK